MGATGVPAAPSLAAAAAKALSVAALASLSSPRAVVGRRPDETAGCFGTVSSQSLSSPRATLMSPRAAKLTLPSSSSGNSLTDTNEEHTILQAIPPIIEALEIIKSIDGQLTENVGVFNLQNLPNILNVFTKKMEGFQEKLGSWKGWIAFSKKDR